MSKAYDAMIIAPHPDDAEFGMGGTMIQLSRAGKSVISVCLTQGEMGTYGTPEGRRKEFEHAAEICGATPLMLDFPDTGVENNRESRVRLARLMREYKPQIIFTPYYKNDLALPKGLVHVDHYTTGALVRDAVKFSRLKNTVPDIDPHTIQKLYFFMLPHTHPGNIYIDVTDVIDTMQESIQAYTTQLAIASGDNSIFDMLLADKAANGLAIGRKYAERFATDQPTAYSADTFFELC